jgi:ABC-type cobalt transport system substrate-binding protein
MRLLFVITASLLFFIFPIFLIAGEYSEEDEQFKEANIDKLKPYGPGFNEDQRPVWEKNTQQVTPKIN